MKPSGVLPRALVVALVLLAIVAGAVADTRAADAPSAPTITVYPPNPSNSPTATFEWSSVQEGLTYRCRLDALDFLDCTSPQTYENLAAGSHTFQVRAVDAGVESEPASYTWTIDLTPPAKPDLRGKPSNPSNDPMPKFNWVGENGVTFVCTLDGNSKVCTSPYDDPDYSAPLSEGQHTFQVRAKDTAGNLGTAATWNWTVDLTAPDGVTGTPDREPDANGWYNHAVTVVFTSNDPTATCTPPVTYAGPDSEGVTVAGRCTDPATNSTDATVTLNYDATPPTNVTGAPTRAPINGWYGSPVVVAFTGSDATSGIQACTSATYSGPDGVGVSVEGTCTDNAGKVSPPAFSSIFKYDGTPPEVGLTAPADGSATADTTPRFRGTTNNGPADADTVRVSVSSVSGPTQTVDAPVASDGSWSATPALELAPGEYQIQATQTDALARSDESPVHRFTIDPTLPRVRISSPAHGTVTNNASLSISGAAGTGTAFEPTVKVSIYAGTSSLGAPLLELSVPVSSGAWSTVSSPLADGVYTLVAEQSDLAGGTASDSIAVEIDTTPPEPLAGATQVSGYGYVKLHWTRPLSWGTTDKVVITKSRVGTVTVYNGTGTLLKDGRVTNGYTYTYTLIPRDAAGNNGTPLSKRARPTGFLAPRHGAHVLEPPLVRWVDVPRSTYANIQLYLVTSVGMKKIWSVWPIADRFQLKSRWIYRGNVYRLRAGRHYRVYGWPGFGAKSDARYGEWFGWVDFTYR